MAQNLKTEPAKIDIEKLEPLSAQELSLVEAIAIGKNNTEAYRIAYGAEGYSPASLRVRACQKVAEKKIQEYLRALRAAGLNNALITKEQHVEAILADIQEAKNAGNYGASSSLRKQVAECMGFNAPISVDHTFDPAQTLREIAQLNPELATKLAEQNNIPWARTDNESAATKH